jgi:hypothetical protein
MMNPIVRFFVVAVLLALSPAPSFALRALGVMSKEEAKAAGLEVRATASGPDAVWVEVDFKTEGDLKGFNPERQGDLVELKLREGEKSLLTSVMQWKQTSPGRYVVSFLADRKQLEKVVVTIVVGRGLLPDGGAYEVRMKDFVELEKVR